MNEAFFKYAMDKLNNMSQDDLSEGLAEAGFESCTKDNEVTLYVTFSTQTARFVEFRKRIIGRCRELLPDDDWSFSASHGKIKRNNGSVGKVSIIVWSEAHASVLKLAFDSEITVEISCNKPDLSD